MRSFSVGALSAVISVNMLKGCYKASSGISQVENAKFSLSAWYKYFLCVYCSLCKGWNMCWACFLLVCVLLCQSVYLRRCCVVTPLVWSGCAPLTRSKSGLHVAQFHLVLPSLCRRVSSICKIDLVSLGFTCSYT